MHRLHSTSLPDVPAAVRRPAYPREDLALGMAHLGVGAFHRCHQAEFTDDMLEQRFGPWGVVGINLRAPRLTPALGPQNGLYARRLRADDRADDLRVIGCLRKIIDAQDGLAEAIDTLADPRVSVMTMTVTEKGYCHVPATGKLDETHPDILHDLAHPDAPRSVPGFVLAAIECRRVSGAGPMTFISCDNIPANGAILERVVRRLAEARSPALRDWIAGQVAFPSTMVDRIVPAVTTSDVDSIGAALGLRDEACVTGEPFRQWVLEDRFAGARPPWDLAGAAFVPDVTGHELIKMRVLNGAQTAFCTLGALIGLDFTFEDARHPVLGPLIRRMLETETASTLPVVSGMEPQPYIELSLARLRNTAIRHTNHQIATDGSQKIVQRLLNPIRNRIGQGRPFEVLACAVAGFVAYLAKASPAFGAAWQPSDPFAKTLEAIATETGPNPGALVRRVLDVSAIFGTDLPRHPAFGAALARHTAGLLNNPAAHLAALLQSSTA